MGHLGCGIHHPRHAQTESMATNFCSVQNPPFLAVKQPQRGDKNLYNAPSTWSVIVCDTGARVCGQAKRTFRRYEQNRIIVLWIIKGAASTTQTVVHSSRTSSGMASSSSAPNAHATGTAGEAESSNPWKRRVTDHRHDTPEERSAAVAAALSQYLTSLFGHDTCMLTGNDDSVDKIHCLPRSLQVKDPELVRHSLLSRAHLLMMRV